MEDGELVVVELCWRIRDLLRPAGGVLNHAARRPDSPPRSSATAGGLRPPQRHVPSTCIFVAGDDSGRNTGITLWYFSHVTLFWYILGQSCSVPNPPGQTQSSSTSANLFQHIRIQISRQCTVDIDTNSLRLRRIHPHGYLDQTGYGGSLGESHLYARRVSCRWLKQ